MSSTRELQSFLNTLVSNGIYDPVMIWGAPGLGKSSVVAATANQFNLKFVDVRISQITPADLRGLPAADIPNNSFKYLPPDFLPKAGDLPGVLFLDEITQAPPAVQAITQQLILDRRVGSYILPDNWFIWAAGNRQQDKTAVYSMPTALANRFHHVEVSIDFETWKLDYALANIDEAIVSFLSLRPELLHKMQVDSHAWPSPRSWAMANRLHQANLNIGYAVGPATAAEFAGFLIVYKDLPNLDAIVSGKGKDIKWPKQEVSAQYAVTIGLLQRCLKASNAELVNIVKWMAIKGRPEYSTKMLHELLDMGPKRVPGLLHLMSSINRDPDLDMFVGQAHELGKLAQQ